MSGTFRSSDIKIWDGNSFLDVENRLRSTVSRVLILDWEWKCTEETKRTLNLREITGPELRSVVLGGMVVNG